MALDVCGNASRAFNNELETQNVVGRSFVFGRDMKRNEMDAVMDKADARKTCINV